MVAQAATSRISDGDESKAERWNRESFERTRRQLLAEAGEPLNRNLPPDAAVMIHAVRRSVLRVELLAESAILLARGMASPEGADALLEMDAMIRRLKAAVEGAGAAASRRPALSVSTADGVAA